MKSVIIYYSYTGNTRKVAHILSEYLSQISEVEILELKALDEKNKFFQQAVRAFCHKKAKIGSINFNLNNYDLICFGTPVWAFSPSPAMNTYLDRCFSLENKSVVLFVTHHSGRGVERCLNCMQNLLTKKGLKNFKRFSISQFKVEDREFVLSKIKEISPP